MDTFDDALLITAAGYQELEREYLELTANGRRRMSERVRDARLDGGIADNPALLELLEEQLQLESRIASLSAKLAAAQVATPSADGRAGVGSAVRVRHRESGDVAEYELVGTIESGVGQRRVSIGAPVGRALLGHLPGALVEVTTPRGQLALEVSACATRALSMKRREGNGDREMSEVTFDGLVLNKAPGLVMTPRSGQ